MFFGYLWLRPFDYSARFLYINLTKKRNGERKSKNIVEDARFVLPKHKNDPD